MYLEPNQLISLALLDGRLVVVIIMLHVIRKQRGYLRSKEHPELGVLRRNLLFGSFVAMAGNIPAIILDVGGLFKMGSFGLLLFYVFANNIAAIVSAYVLWMNIKLTERIKLADASDHRDELNKLDH